MHTIIAAFDWWDIVGRTMLHYLWIGRWWEGLLSVGAPRALVRVMPHVRYFAALGFLAFLAVAAVGVAIYLATQGYMNLGRSSIAEPTLGPKPGGSTGSTTFSQPSSLRKPVGARHWRSQIGGRRIVCVCRAFGAGGRSRHAMASLGLDRWHPADVASCCIRTLRGGTDGARAVLVLEGPIARADEKSAEVLRLSREVAIAVSDRVVTPLVLGVVRLMVLLPASAVSGWSPEQLEMILLHELAHVRRWITWSTFCSES